MEISEPKVRSTINMQKTTESNAFSRFESNWNFCYMLLTFFFNLLVNRSMLDFLLDTGKRSLRSRRPSNNRKRERIRAQLRPCPH